MRQHCRQSLRAVCAEVYDDDGVDPRQAASRRQPSQAKKENRKTLQLCKQVARALTLSLADECMDPGFRAIQIAAVLPAPDSTHLAVCVQLDSEDNSCVPSEVIARLREAAGFFRSQIAAAIARKRVPELTFRWAAGSEDPR
ncbi:MAG: ribosome-binding factor A [Phycisphaerales bacterium]|nr:ribosome-binding factor A [Phycisphaerales bacterium]